MRSHATESYKYGDAVQLYDNTTKTWHGTYKLVFNSGRNCYVELGNKMKKVPTHWIRKLVPAKILSDPQDNNSRETETMVKNPMDQTKESEIHPGESVSRNIGDQPRTTPSESSDQNQPTFAPWERYNLRSQNQNWWCQQDVLDGLLCGSDESIIQKILPVTQDDVDSQNKITNGATLRQNILDSNEMVDLSRLTPKIYLPLPAGRQALRDEIYGILRHDKDGIPVGEIVKKGDYKWEKVPWVMTTVVTKIKTDGSVKSRLCLRGDRIPTINQPFASAPTVSRDFLKIFLRIICKYAPFSMDPSRYFQGFYTVGSVAH